MYRLRFFPVPHGSQDGKNFFSGNIFRAEVQEDLKPGLDFH
jgi:hypothetical protein